jgi:hypothetical protein
MRIFLRHVLLPLVVFAVLYIGIIAVAVLLTDGNPEIEERMAPFAYEHMFGEVIEGSAIPSSDPIFILYSLAESVIAFFLPSFLAARNTPTKWLWLSALPFIFGSIIPASLRVCSLLRFSEFNSLPSTALLAVALPVTFSAGVFVLGVYLARTNWG